jgi:hypothetical protein
MRYGVVLGASRDMTNTRIAIELQGKPMAAPSVPCVLAFVQGQGLQATLAGPYE